MALNIDGIIHLVITGLADHTFGSVMLSCVFLMLFTVVFALLITIPVPFALAIPLPMAITFAAYGYMSPLAAGLLSAGFMVLAIGSFLTGMGNR